ncbi:MAG: hypothetical protein V4655_06925 [Bdellovibrionota bacterium]
MNQMKSMLLLIGLGASSIGLGQTNAELAENAANVLGIAREGLCSSCHSLNSERTITRWATATKAVESCLSATGTSKSKLACISGSSVDSTFDVTPSQLGIYAAAVHLDPIKSLITSTYGATKGKTILDDLLANVSMPMNSSARLSAAQFSAIQKWFAAGTPELSKLLSPAPVETNVCTPTFTSSLTTHLASQNLDSWKTRIESQQTPMFACPTNGGACFTQQRAGADIFPDVSTNAVSKSWKLDSASSMRTITEFSGSRQYWIRSSPDGRFVGFGGKPSGMIDLQPLLSATPRQRVISINALYDPGFFPDDSGFIFQGNTTGMCNMDILRKSSTTSITFEEDACTVLDTKVPLYQSVGAGLNGEDYLALISSYQRDSGLDGTMDEFLPTEDLTAAANNYVTLYGLAYDGQSWVRQSGQTFKVPYEIDWVLSHSNQLGMSRVQAERDGVVRTKGFNLYKFNKNSQGQYTKTNIANLCGEGLKGDFSYDERFYITYSYVRADQWKYFGYKSASDPAFQAKLKSGAADLFLYDLFAKKTYALTNMGADQYALFPHFRADGWVYFEVYDRNTRRRSVVATDAAIRQARSLPFKAD